MKQLALQLVSDPPRRARTAALRSAHFQSHVPAAEALATEARCQSQEAILLQWFQVHQTARVTPWEVSEALGIFIVSARRAMTNLAAAGLLAHYPGDRRASGPYGQKSGTWALA